MAKKENCEYCGRPIKGEPEIKILRSVEHVYCSDFYDAPTLTYERLQNMYNLRCVSLMLD
jgi:hypothetical protein